MLISNPLLPPNEKFPEDLLVQGLDPLSGIYPVGPGQLWHGGIHVCCGATQPHDVYAIADGVVVGYRQATAPPEDAKQLDDHPLNYMGWTDDGFVLLKHEKESGDGVPVVFYSLYMHLSKLDDKLFPGAPGQVVPNGKTRISRKECLGKLGKVYGKADSMHFEIFTGKADLEKFLKQKETGDGNQGLWGDVHFILPAGTPYTLEEPTPAHPAPAAPRQTIQELMISLSYGASSDNKPGSRILKTRRRTGEQIDLLEEAGAEYQLYQRAQKWFPKNASAGYELLRHGRVFGPDPLPAGAKNWQRVPLGYGIAGWVDLNAPGIRKLSDADFPDWQWRLVQEDAKLFNTNDGKCDAPELLKLIDADNDGLLAPLEVAAAMQDPAIQKQMRHAVCLFPSEWDAGDDATVQRKWGWLKEYFKNPASRHKELAEKQKQWVQAAKAKAEARLASLQKELDDTQAGKKQMEARKAEYLKQRDAAAKALKEAQQQQKTKQDAVTTLRKYKHPSPEDIRQAEEQAQQAQQETEEAKEALAKHEQALQIETDNIAKVGTGIAFLESEKQAAQGIVDRAGKAFEAADKAIAAATEALKQPPKDPEQAWAKFKKHVMALSWWDALKGTLGDATVWHFHPVAFIEHFRKCHWLSKGELALIYSHTPEAIREKYRVAVNKVLYRYGMTNAVRMAHFFGQGAVESDCLQLMVEASNPPHRTASLAEETNGYYANSKDLYGYFYNYEKAGNDKGNTEQSEFRNSSGELLPIVLGRDERNRPIVVSPSSDAIDPSKSRVGDGMKFRGRGMKQLTGKANYAGYWVYRGWLVEVVDFDANWWSKKNSRPAPINDPQRISVVPFNAIDSAGWFAIKNGIPKAADGGLNQNASNNVSAIINRWDTPSFPRRWAATQSAEKILGDTV